MIVSIPLAAPAARPVAGASIGSIEWNDNLAARRLTYSGDNVWQAMHVLPGMNMGTSP
jgi:hypothetical protein